MPAKKTPNYDEMSLEELDQAASNHRAAIAELGASVDADAPAAEKLAAQLKMSEHRAHLAVINPLRSEAMVADEFDRSQMAKRMRKMTDREWEKVAQRVRPGSPAKRAQVHRPEASE